MNIAEVESAPVLPQDGRVLRSTRTRERILNAMRRFADEGRFDPMVVEIAQRAAVSVRTVYQHYQCVAELRAAALTDEHWTREAARLRALPDRELVEASIRWSR